MSIEWTQDETAVRRAVYDDRASSAVSLYGSESPALNEDEWFQANENAATPQHWFVPGIPILQAGPREVRPIINGESFARHLLSELRDARCHIFLTGLHFMYDFGLTRPGHGEDLARVLLSMAERGVKIYLLVNLFWREEKNVLGHFRSNNLFSSSPTMAQVRSAFSDRVPRGDARGERMRRLENGIRGLVAHQGKLYHYFPATYDLFSALRGSTHIKCRADIHPGHYMHSHHQKTVIIDDKIAYVGGIDLTHVDGDRFDNRHHGIPRRHVEGRHEAYWHDVHSRLGGALPRFVSENFKERWRRGVLYKIDWSQIPSPSPMPSPVPISRDLNAVREQFPDPTQCPGVSPPPPERPVRRRPYSVESLRAASGFRPLVQHVRSMPQGRGYVARPAGRTWERSAKDAYLTGLDASNQYIYLENQWISDEDIWNGMARAARRNRSRNNANFRIVIMLPYSPLRAAGAGANQNIFFELGIIKTLLNCRDSHTFSMFSLLHEPARGTDRAGHRVSVPVKQIYVHSKMMIIDDVWHLIGSANAGGISLEGIREYGILGGGSMPDTELSYACLSPGHATQLRVALWNMHLGRGVAGGSVPDYVRTFRGVADGNRSRLRHSPNLVNPDLRFFSFTLSEWLDWIRRHSISDARRVLRTLVALLNRLRQTAEQFRRGATQSTRRMGERLAREIAEILNTFRSVLSRIPGLGESVDSIVSEEYGFMDELD